MKSRLAVAIAAIIFLALILIGEFSPFGELIPTNGITRDGVDKYRIHVLSTPDLEGEAIKKTTLNVTATLRQLGDCDLFRADGGYDFYAYFKLTDTWDFKEIDPPKKTDQKSNKKRDDGPELVYSIKMLEGKAMLTVNDEPLKELDAKPSDRSALFTLNSNKSAVFRGKENDKLYYIANLTEPVAQTIDVGEKIRQISVDHFGAGIYLLVERPGTSNDINKFKVKYMNSKSGNLSQVDLDTAISIKSTIYYNEMAGAVAILDQEKLRIIDARTGSIRGIHHFPRNARANLAMLPKVPGAIFVDRLLDLRSAEEIDQLPGFHADSCYTVDYKNKRLYYSTGDSQKAQAKIASYDLHNLHLEQQVTLSTYADESEHGNKDEKVEKLFMTNSGKLIALSVPR